MSRRPARAVRALAVAVSVAVLLSGCLFGRPIWQRGAEAPGPTPGASVPAPSRATTAPSPGGGSSSPTAPSRPVQPVPDVRPNGFTSPPSGSGLARYTGQQLDWSKCGELQCTKTLVPLDYQDPDGQAITLALARKPATESPRLGSLFINPGGPGGSGVQYVGFFDSLGLEQYDIVGWDPRGVGASTPVTCFNRARLDAYLARDSSPDSAEEDTQLRNDEQEFGKSCLERSGRLLEHVSTAETARDLDVLRALVGDAKLRYFGSSYGTQIGATYAQLFPKKVAKLVLDGAVNISDDRSVSQTEGFDRALTAFATWCAQQRCRLGSTKAKVLSSISSLWKRLDSDPMEGGRRPLTQQLAVVGVLVVLYQNEEGWKSLRFALELAVFRDDPRVLLLLADSYHRRDAKTGVFGQDNFGFPAVRCLDKQQSDPEEARREADNDRAKAPTLGYVSGPDYVCPMWPVAPAPKGPKITGAGAPPILVIGTTGDPATPYEYAQRMAQQLTSGVLVTYRGEGHLAYGDSECVQAIVRNYLVRGKVPADGVTC